MGCGSCSYRQRNHFHQVSRCRRLRSVGRRLTIHSSRSRFAARLNSGVRPLRAGLLLPCRKRYFSLRSASCRFGKPIGRARPFHWGACHSTRRSAAACLRVQGCARSPRRAAGVPCFGTSSFGQSAGRARFTSVGARSVRRLTRVAHDQAASAPRARSFWRAADSCGIRSSPVPCQPMILVGKWRPNDSFKPNPLRSCNDPAASRGGSA